MRSAEMLEAHVDLCHLLQAGCSRGTVRGASSVQEELEEAAVAQE